MNRAFLPYDVYERHRKISQFISPGDTVLDVGGELNHLSQFVNPKKLIVANLNTGDVLIKKDHLPFTTNEYDVVCSIDVVEHIPKKERSNFVNKLKNIAGKKILLSFPVGTDTHNAYEKKIQEYLKAKKIDVKYLSEHIKHGLPGEEEINTYVDGYKHQLFYSGSIKTNEILFKIFLFDPKIKYIRKFVYFCKLIFNLVTNPILYVILSSKKYSSQVNRAYLIIYK